MKFKLLFWILLIGALVSMAARGADFRLTLIKEGDFGISIDSLSLSPAGNTVSGNLNRTEVVEVDFPAGTEVALSVLAAPPFIPEDFHALIAGIIDSTGNLCNQSINILMDVDRTIRVLYKTYPSSRDVQADSYLHALLITGNTDLNPGDRAVVRRMQRLGYKMTPVLGSELTRELVNSAQLVLISSTSESTLINAEALHINTSVICWNQEVYNNYDIINLYNCSTGVSTGDTLEVLRNFSGIQTPGAPDEYVVEQITTQPAELGWIQTGSGAMYTPAYTDMSTKKTAMFMANSAANRRATIFLRDNTALYLNDRGWHLFDCLVNEVVSRIRVRTSPSSPTVLRTADSFILNLENQGIGCNWQLLPSDFNWVIPSASAGRLDAGSTGRVELVIDWAQFSDGETKVKRNLNLTFNNPDFGNEVDHTSLILTATNAAQPDPRPPGSIWFEPKEIIVAPGASFRLEFHVNTGDHRLTKYSLICLFDESYLESDTWNYLPGSSGFISEVSTTPDNPGYAGVSGFDPAGTGPDTELHLLTIQARSTATSGTSKINLKLQGPLRDDADNVLGIILREAEMSVTVANSLRGDMDGDRRVTIVDALRVARVYVGLEQQILNLSAGDVNRNGVMDIIDALMIAQYYVGLIKEFPGS